MAKVNLVKKANKPNAVVSQDDIDRANAGEAGAASYYWWAFRFGGKHYSKAYPRASMLTQSEFLSSIYGLCEQLEDMRSEHYATLEDLKSEVDSVVDEIRSLGEEQTDKLYNMPDGLQQGDTGQLLEGRGESCEEMCSELEGIDFDKQDEETEEEAIERVLEEVQAVSYSGE
jgi:hypothetical protein